MTPLALLVDLEPDSLACLASLVGGFGFQVVLYATFRAARQALELRPAVLLTNIRLGAFNGIHLVHLAKAMDRDVRAIAYASTHDGVLARDAQHAGAFYERESFLRYALRGYLTAPLPNRDRRDVALLDRRQIFRGGRRCTDIPLLRGVAVTV